jgi:hypothetical protein
MSYRLEVGLALLLATAIGIAVWAANRTPKPPEQDFRASTFLSGPQGSKALYDVLARLGRPVQRRRTPFFTLDQDSLRAPALLVLLNPPMPLQAAELEQLARYIKEGGSVLAAGNGAGLLRCTGWRLRPERWSADSVAVRPAAGFDGKLPRVARVLTPRKMEGSAADRLRRLVKRQPIEEDPCETLLASERDTLLTAIDGRPVILRLRYAGGGSITFAADVGWFTNRLWRDTDVPLALLPLFAAPTGRRGRIIVDEYHQGFGRDQGSITGLTWDWLREAPAGWAILQLTAVALIWLAVTAVRFGPPREVVERRRRSPLEHLEALAAGLESASAADTSVQRLVTGLRRRLSRAGGAPMESGNLQPWLQSLELATRGPKGRAAVRRLRHLIAERNGGQGAADRVLATAQAVEDVWEELRPRTTREQF